MAERDRNNRHRMYTDRDNRNHKEEVDMKGSKLLGSILIAIGIACIIAMFL